VTNMRLETPPLLSSRQIGAPYAIVTHDLFGLGSSNDRAKLLHAEYIANARARTVGGGARARERHMPRSASLGEPRPAASKLRTLPALRPARPSKASVPRRLPGRARPAAWHLWIDCQPIDCTSARGHIALSLVSQFSPRLLIAGAGWETEYDAGHPGPATFSLQGVVLH
jgi:hypothetical protein